MDSIPQKRCTKCGVEKPATLEFFRPETKTKSGIASICRECTRLAGRDRYQKPDVKERAAKRRSDPEYKKKHQEYCHQPDQLQKARERNKRPERVAAQKESERRPERIAWRKNYKKSPKVKAYDYQYRRRPKTKVSNRIKEHKRRTVQRDLPVSFTVADWMRALDYFGNHCAVCGKPAGLWHVLAQDHWIPLKSPDCPGTIPNNIIPLCHARKDGEFGCNNSKSSRLPETWLLEKYGKRQAKKILNRINTYFEWLTTQS